MVGFDSWIETVNMSFIYAKCTRVDRHSLRSELSSITGSVTRPWLVGGYFNVISTLAEYAGRAAQDLGAISDFNTAISDYHLQEVPYSDSPYTWSGIRAGARVWKRLDRVLANHQWLSFLPNTSVQHLNRATSDHSPLLSNWALSADGYGMYRLAFKLKRLKGAWAEAEEQIAQEAVNFFQRLLTAEDVSDVDELLAYIPEIVSEDQNADFLWEITLEELKGVVFNLDKDSALGADGYTGIFFRHCWDTVAPDVLAAARDFWLGP
ncbi:uncharacterized protein [Coffea arabica]|uniref:Endonuclease/exonuclease/phosphatase domain-containing protein n=1 Tax=Coffea arabica TaxID=13443 RepID=A0ABM4V9M6_COFAR